MRPDEIQDLNTQVGHLLAYTSYVEAKIAVNEDPLLWTDEWEKEDE